MTISTGNLLRTALIFVVCLAGAACQKKREPPGPVKEYQLTGQVIRLDAGNKTAVIKHQKIEGWMEAMTMEFPVKDQADFSKLREGEKISGTVFVQGTTYWVGEIQEDLGAIPASK